MAQGQHLISAPGSATTLSGVNDADYSYDIMILLLQEPWTDIKGLPPPPSMNYNMDTHPGRRPRCATYIRNQINQNARNITPYGNHSLKLTINVNNTDKDILNVYSLGKSVPISKVIPTLDLKPATYIAGDFNSHNKWSDADQAIRHTNLLQGDLSVSEITVWMILQKMTLANTLNLFTHDLKNSNALAIIEL